VSMISNDKYVKDHLIKESLRINIYEIMQLSVKYEGIDVS